MRTASNWPGLSAWAVAHASPFTVNVTLYLSFSKRFEIILLLMGSSSATSTRNADGEASDFDDASSTQTPRPDAPDLPADDYER